MLSFCVYFRFALVFGPQIEEECKKFCKFAGLNTVCVVGGQDIETQVRTAFTIIPPSSVPYVPSAYGRKSITGGAYVIYSNQNLRLPQKTYVPLCLDIILSSDYYVPL